MAQKLYRYNKPAAEGETKAPFILCYANNEMHAMQVLRDRLNGEKIDKTLIQEYVMKESKKENKKKKTS